MDWSIYNDCKGDVLVVACKYLILDLKHHVERQLAREITTETLVELALLSDSYFCDQLKKVGRVRFFVSSLIPLYRISSFRHASSSSPPTARLWCSLRNGTR